MKYLMTRGNNWYVVESAYVFKETRINYKSEETKISEAEKYSSRISVTKTVLRICKNSGKLGKAW